ncbi:MAG: HAMP domain-containing protein [Cyanobacteria bacterium SBLK]|nr:HAMP domain-containing protein [Cyanobacteria bacterium SBLK]
MQLRQKTLLAIGGLLTGLIAVLSVSLSSTLSRSFRQVEKKNTLENVQRAISVLQEELDRLEIITSDWGHWDDMYEFVEDSNQEFIETNLTSSAIENLQLNFLAILNNQGKTTYELGLDLESLEEMTLPPSLKLHFSLDRPILQYETIDSGLKGLLLLPENIVLIASQPILNSKEEGSPRGAFAVGRYLTRTKIAEIEQRAQLSLNFYRLDDRELSPDIREIYIRLDEKFVLEPEEVAIVTQPLDEEKIAGYTVVRDIYDNPALLLQVTIPREIYQQGRTSLRYLILLLWGVGIVFSIGTLIFVERIVLLRLSHLSTEVKKIGLAHDSSQRIQLSGNDELTGLAQTINWMLESLESSEKEVQQEREKAEALLLNIFPESIARTLKSKRSAIAQHFESVTILFADLVGFTELSARLSPIELVELLNEIFSQFDRLVGDFGLEKIKTIGDAYMIASGLPIPREDHAEAMAEMALAMHKTMQSFQRHNGESFQMRIGINTGAAVAGAIGQKKFIYDLWGDAVNVASRMESLGKPAAIQVSTTTYKLLKDKYSFERRGQIWVKGKGIMTTYWLIDKK